MLMMVWATFRAHAGAGDGHGDGGLGTGHEGVQDVLDAHAADGPQLRHHDGDHDGPEGAEDDGLAAPDQHVQQEHNGDQQMAPVTHDLAGLGHLVLGQAVEAVLGGPHLDLDDDAQIVDQGGDDGGLDNDAVLNAQGLRHDEGGGAHDGGQQLAAHGGGGLHGAGELLGVAGLLHQGNGEGAGGDHVGHGGAVDGAQEAGGQNGHLGGAALGVAGQGVGDVVEELAHAALVHDLAENDK